MSEPGVNQHLEHPRQEAESIPARKAVLVAAIALAIFALAVYEADRIFHREESALIPGRAPPLPKELGQPEIGMVNQKPFDRQQEAEQLRIQQTEQLNSYGWVDRKNQVIHIPIERAMEVLVSRSKR